MTTYFVAKVTIQDPDRYRLYEAGFMPILQKHGGRLVVVSDTPETVEGDWGEGRLVVVAFDTPEAARGWVTSPEYQAVAQHRFAAADSTIVMAEGLI